MVVRLYHFSSTHCSSEKMLKRRRSTMDTWEISWSKERRSRMLQNKLRTSRRHRILGELGKILSKRISLKLTGCIRNSKLIKRTITKKCLRIASKRLGRGLLKHRDWPKSQSWERVGWPEKCVITGEDVTERWLMARERGRNLIKRPKRGSKKRKRLCCRRSA